MKHQIDSDTVKRLFFGFEVEAAWIDSIPSQDRVLTEENRHITLAFLGNQSLLQLQHDLKDFPDLSDRLGPVGLCNNLLFLPPKAPRVVASQVDWFDSKNLLQIHQELTAWLLKHQYPVERRELLSHVTLARQPFSIKKWKEAFSPFPLITKALHLYESLGNLNYRPVWSLPFLAPIEEIEHTADVAFKIRGETLSQVFTHALAALAFKSPHMIKYRKDPTSPQTVDDIIIALNRIISETDSTVGCPFKAVSFHGEITQEANGILTWEMIVDV